ncbi:hypothetical protein M0813_27422 [Anaeramoeba flamelloides]|uniref:Uncharacterized protein n=1 Tax=Anaeramoeba flamelloides TaxID=1746091 RepID=A0ABQ8XVP6_9EUKA|nr:hypothetical protein M0813_27422 [Anaeramoeba flamelloides]
MQLIKFTCYFLLVYLAFPIKTNDIQVESENEVTIIPFFQEDQLTNKAKQYLIGTKETTYRSIFGERESGWVEKFSLQQQKFDDNTIYFDTKENCFFHQYDVFAKEKKSLALLLSFSTVTIYCRDLTELSEKSYRATIKTVHNAFFPLQLNPTLHITLRDENKTRTYFGNETYIDWNTNQKNIQKPGIEISGATIMSLYTKLSQLNFKEEGKYTTSMIPDENNANSATVIDFDKFQFPEPEPLEEETLISNFKEYWNNSGQKQKVVLVLFLFFNTLFLIVSLSFLK